MIALVVAAGAICSGCATGLTGSPDTISHTGAVLEGNVVSTEGGEVEYWVEFGPTAAYGSETPHATIATVANQPTPVEVSLGGLQRATSYHYRLCASDASQSGGPGCGEDRRLKTQSFACGDTVTSNVRLTGDVQCPERFTPAIRVGANNLDINLNGFELRGQTVPGDGGGGTYAIQNSGFDDVTVRDGGTVNWVGGVQVLEAQRNLLVRLRGLGIQLYAGGLHEVRHNELSSPFSAVSVDESVGVVVADNRLQSPGTVIGFDLSDGARVVRNEVRGLVQACCDGVGIGITESDSQVRDNRVTSIDGIGIRVLSGAGHVLVGNVVTNVVEDEPDPFLDPDTDGDGILFDIGAAGALRDNTASHNAGDGIDVNVAGARLGRNHADFNGLFGIDAPPGSTIDEGGNTATGNGDPLQCRGVVCQ